MTGGWTGGRSYDSVTVATAHGVPLDLAGTGLIRPTPAYGIETRGLLVRFVDVVFRRCGADPVDEVFPVRAGKAVGCHLRSPA